MATKPLTAYELNFHCGCQMTIGASTRLVRWSYCIRDWPQLPWESKEEKKS